MADFSIRSNPPNIKFTPEKLDSMKRQLDDGATVKELAEQEGVVPGRINYLMRKHARSSGRDRKVGEDLHKPS